MGCISSKGTTTPSTTKQKIPPAPARRGSHAGVHELKQLYNINKKVLGSGSFGKVFMAENKSDSTVQVAIKVIAKQKLSEAEIIALHTEV